MSHLHDQSADQTRDQVRQAPQPADAPAVARLPNVVTGVVSARLEGLTRTTYRIRIGAHTDLRMRWPRSTSTRRTLELGQPVRLTIPQEAVHLEAGGFRQGKQRWNRWIGRVVLAAKQSEDGSVTVKIHHTPMTLKCRGPVIGSRRPLATWDTVNIVVDPQHIKVCNCRLAAPQPRSTAVGAADTTTSVWLRATIRSIRPLSAGTYLTLRAGGATLSILIETENTATTIWGVGHAIEVAIGSGDAWVRQNALGPVLPCCVVLSSDFDGAPQSGFAQQRDRSRAAS